MIGGISGKSPTAERKLVVRLWELLEGERRGGVDLASLRTVVSAILGLHRGFRPGPQRVGGTSFGKYVGDDYAMTETEAAEWHRLFKLMCTNKMSAVAAQKHVPAGCRAKVGSLLPKRQVPRSQRKPVPPVEEKARARPSLNDLLSVVKREQERILLAKEQAQQAKEETKQVAASNK